LKILQIIPSLQKGGAERLVTDIVRELSARQGIEVRLVLFRDEIAYDIEDIRHLVHIIPSSVQLSLWRKNKYHIAELQLFLNDFQPDVIHSHLFEAEIVSRSCYFPKAKWFSHGHDNMQQLHKFQFSGQLSKARITEFFERSYLLKRYNRNGGTTFIPISKHTENYLKQNIPKQGRLLLLNAINYDKFKNDVIREGFTNTIKLINVGSFVPKKNQQLLILIAEKLEKQNIDFEVHFLGDGAMRNDIQGIAEEKKINAKIHFHGNVNHVEKHLAQASIYIHTAKYEPLGLVLLEAMAAGLPVITLDGGGNRDLMVEGKNGFLIESENAELFVEKILYLKDKKALYQAMSAYARDFAKQFDIKNYVDQLLALYKA
jgi:glycosyltransferase involved in cell wall biosynthesis